MYTSEGAKARERSATSGAGASPAIPTALTTLGHVLKVGDSTLFSTELVRQIAIISIPIAALEARCPPSPPRVHQVTSAFPMSI